MAVHEVLVLIMLIHLSIKSDNDEFFYNQNMFNSGSSSYTKSDPISRANLSQRMRGVSGFI